MATLTTILTILEVIASIVLIVVVLLQSSKESGMGAIAGNSNSFMNQGKAATRDQKLAKITKWTALVWILLTLALSLI